MRVAKRFERRIRAVEQDHGGGPLVGEEADVVGLLHFQAWTRRQGLQHLWVMDWASRAGPNEPRDPERVLGFLHLAESMALLRFVSGDLPVGRRSNLCWDFARWTEPEVLVFAKFTLWAGDHRAGAGQGPVLGAEELQAVEGPGFVEKMDRAYDHRDAVHAADEGILAAIVAEGRHR